MPTDDPESATDECYRCGYDLREFTNNQACPECGLLAERSRRVSDALHNTRPRWLRSLSWGINLILLAILAPFFGPVLAVFLFNPNPSLDVVLFGFDLGAILFFLGALFLTRREEYPPADHADRRLRIILRWVAVVPMLIVAFLQFQSYLWATYTIGVSYDPIWITVIPSIFLSPLPLLLFLRLRGLAVRARSAHLFEHCKIVGIGASASLLYIAGAAILLAHPEWFGLGENWGTQSGASLLVQLLLGVAACLFILWSLYLLVRFAIAFWFASRQLRKKWLRDDRSQATEP